MLGFLCSFLQTLQCHWVLAEVNGGLFLELISDVINQDLIKIITTQVAITVGSQHFENAIADVQNGDVEGSPAQVEHRNSGVGLLVEAVGQRRGRGLVDDAFDFQPRNFSGILGGLPLRVIEIGRHRDHRPVHFFTQVILGGLLEFTQDHRAHFLGGVILVPNMHTDKLGGRTFHFIGHLLLFAGDLFRSTAHEAFDGENGVLGVGHLLVPCRLTDQPLPFFCETNHRRGRAVAARVDDDLGLVTFHDGYHRVGCTEVNTNDL